jgi:type IV pilus assembly protein PilY1
VQSGTPLRTALYGVGEYYTKDSPWADDPANMAFADPVGSGPKDCRRAYHLLVTDGLWNTTGAPFSASVGNYDNTLTAGFYETITSTSATSYTYVPQAPHTDSNSDYLADFASYFFNRDLRATIQNNLQPSPPSKLSWQGMVNFVVGIGLKGNLDPTQDLAALTAGTKTWGTNKVDDLWHAAINSEGKYFSARNSTELANSLTSALTATLQVELKEAGVATTTNVLEDGNRKYVPIYKSGKWTGDIRAFELDASGSTKVGPGPNGELWSVAGKVPTWATRKIYTWNESSGAPSLFTWSDMGLLNQAAIGPGLGSSDLVDYLRGDQSKEETVILPSNPFRARESIIGDMINSNPVFIKKGTDLGYQGLSIGGAAYDAYRSSVKAPRAGVLFAGANDGMLHAFLDSQGASPNDGQEIFAYMPRIVYPNLTKLADKNYGTTLLYHQFFIDGAFSETDAYVKATPSSSSAEWRNYLVGSLGAGGRGVLALDVTDMTSPGAANVKWEFSGDADLGYVSAPIEVGVLPNNQWVAIFGNGPLSPSGNGVLFVVDLETGVAQKVVVDGVSTASGLGGVGALRDASGYIKNLYVGDLNGKMWKLNYDAAASGKFVVDGGVPLFEAQNTGGLAQPITQPPALFDHISGGKIVVFGTGKLLVDTDRDTTTLQTVYGVWDKPADTVSRPMMRSLLEGRSISTVTGAGGAVFYSLTGTAVNWTSQRGWTVDLASGSPNILLGERVIYPPQRITSKLALVSAVAPAAQAAVCTSATGLGVNLVIPVDTGANPPEPMFDTNGDGAINASDTSVSGVATKVDGIDALVYGTSGTLCVAPKIQVSIQNTEGAVNICVLPDSPPGGGGGVTAKDRIWRQIINPPIR